MSQFVNIVIGLATELIGYIIGRIWQTVVDQVPYRHVKRFWRPLLGDSIQIVICRFAFGPFVEPGLTGAGDALAMRELTSFFAKARVRRVSAVYVDESSVDRTKNLILLGGPDTNAVTKDALELMGSRLQFSYLNPPSMETVVIHDLSAESNAEGRDHSIYVTVPGKIDYGVIIRAPNPFNPDRWIIILAGAHGYGSWGSASLALDDKFARQLDKLGPRGDAPYLECIFSVRIFDRRPLAPEIIALRAIPSVAKADSAREIAN